MKEIGCQMGEPPTAGCFENMLVRARGDRCVASSVAPPFRTVYWPNVGELASRLGFAKMTPAALAAPDTQARFLTGLAGVMGGTFGRERIGFGSPPAQIRARDALRRAWLSVIFLGAISRPAALGALEAFCGRMGPGATVDLQFKQWDALAEWQVGQEQICDVCNYLYQTRQGSSNLLVFSELRQAPGGLWEFIYERPRVRIAWVAAELGGCRNRTEFEALRQESAPLRNLEKVSTAGLWPHIVLPVTRANVKMLPDLVLGLLEASRGGSIDLAPGGLLLPQPKGGAMARWHSPGGGGPLTAALSPAGARAQRRGESDGERERTGRQVPNLEEVAPPVEEYVEALLAIYRTPEIPLRLVSPVSWVSARVDSQTPLASSPASAGAEVAVLPNGALYAGECGVGLERWRLGNVLEHPDDIRWERLDVMAEACSSAMQPEQCQRCDWRYRCGGADAPILLSADREGLANGGAHRFEFYCAPRKRLFEEILWDSAEHAALGQPQAPRERIELRDDGIDFVPVENASTNHL